MSAMSSIRFIQSILLHQWLIVSISDAVITANIVESTFWDGVGAYIPVDRHIIQRKLDDWYMSHASTCNSPKLYLPEKPVFPNDLDENQHVIFIAPAYSKLNDFQDLHDSCFSLHGIELTVSIPLLTDDPKKLPEYALALGQFYRQSRGEVAKPNLVYPYIPVEEITMDKNTFVMRNGSDELRLSFQKYTHPCEPPSRVVRHELDEFGKREFQFGASRPHFSICDRLTIDNSFCSKAERIRCKVHQSSPNICQTSWNVFKRRVCKSSLEVLNITSGFRDLMLFPDDPIRTIASQTVRGNFSIGLKFPCLNSFKAKETQTRKK